MPFQVRLILVPVVLLVITACGTSGAEGAADVTETEVEIKVEVDVMSGVPNPTWTVRGSEAAALIERVNALPQDGEIDISAALGLGFRGFVLHGLELPGDADNVRVLGSQVVVARGHAAGTLRTDEEHEIYTMLRGMAAEHLDQNVLQAIPVDGREESP